MAQRPNTDPAWAEQADANNIDEPDVERDTGYLKGQSLTHDQLNWLLRELFRWAGWFDERFQGSTGLIDFFTGLDFGEHAEAEKRSDTGSQWYAELVHTDGGDAEWWADWLGANAGLQTDQIAGASQDVVEFLASDRLGLGGALLDVLRAQEAQGDEIDVQDNAGTSGAGGLFLKFLRAKGGSLSLHSENGSEDGILRLGRLYGTLCQVDRLVGDRLRGRTEDIIDVWDSSGTAAGAGELRARNTTRAFASFARTTDGNGNPECTFYNGRGVLDVVRTGAGNYNVQFDTSVLDLPDISDDVVVTLAVGATLQDSNLLIRYDVEFLATPEYVSISVWDDSTSSLVDLPDGTHVSIDAYW